jgi:hypothetical protein
MLQDDFSLSLQSDLETISNCHVVCRLCSPNVVYIVLCVLHWVLPINLSKMYEVECVLGAGYVCQGWTLGNMYDASEEDTKQEEKIAASEACLSSLHWLHSKPLTSPGCDLGSVRWYSPANFLFWFHGIPLR